MPQEIIVRIVVDTDDPTDSALVEIGDYAVRETIESFTPTEMDTDAHGGVPTGDGGYEGPFVAEATAIRIDGPSMAIGDTIVRWSKEGGFE